VGRGDDQGTRVAWKHESREVENRGNRKAGTQGSIEAGKSREKRGGGEAGK